MPQCCMIAPWVSNGTLSKRNLHGSTYIALDAHGDIIQTYIQYCSIQISQTCPNHSVVAGAVSNVLDNCCPIHSITTKLEHKEMY